MKRNRAIILSCAVLVLLFASTQHTYAQWVPTGGPTRIVSPGIGSIFVFNGTITVLMGSDGNYRSGDSGLTWEKTAFHLPDHLNNCLAAKGTMLFAGTDSGVYRSTDDGATWESFRKGLESYPEVHRMAVCGNTIFAMNTGIVYRSTDNGETWTTVTGFTGSTPFAMVAYGNTLFAGNEYGVCRSADDGKTWSCSIEFNSRVDALTVIGNRILAGGNRLQISADGGASWILISSEMHGINSFAVSGDTVFAATDSTLSFSIDSGMSWSSIDLKFGNRYVRSLSLKGNILLAGVAEEMYGPQKVYVSKDRGRTWNTVEFNVPNLGVKDLAASGKTLFATTMSEGLHRSVDNGATWTVVNEAHARYSPRHIFIYGTTVFATFLDTTFRSSDNGTTWSPVSPFTLTGYAVSGPALYAGSYRQGIHRSTDTGKTWAAIANSGIPDSASVMLAANKSTLFAQTDRGLLFRSSDNGATWTPLSTGGNNSACRNLAVQGDTLVYAKVFADSFSIAISTDNGVRWVDVPGFSGKSFRALVISNRFIFVAAGSDVYQAFNNGTGWNMVNTGLDIAREKNQMVACLAVNNTDLFAGVWGNSVWRRPLSDFPLLARKPDRDATVRDGFDVRLPGVLVKSVAISFSLYRSERVEFSVYNVSGSKVQTIAGIDYGPGLNTLVWKTGHLAPGCYWIKMSTTRNVYIKQCSLIR
jgi:photosystem II stability/assembly factor-like uncharacterized protein